MFNIELDKNEILRYLGHRGQEIDTNTETMIDNCIEEIKKISRYRYVYKIFDIKVGYHDAVSCIDVVGTSLRLEGNDIYEHLRECRKCAVMAVTLGIEVDNSIRIAQGNDMLKAVVMDSCATEFIEKVCDEVEKKIKAEAEVLGKGTNLRFSPGYGDLPIDIQKNLLDVLEANRKIGLTVTNSSLMIPGKSVTAIIGFTENISFKKKKSKCDICSMRENCMFRKGGTTCERGRVYKA